MSRPPCKCLTVTMLFMLDILLGITENTCWIKLLETVICDVCKINKLCNRTKLCFLFNFWIFTMYSKITQLLGQTISPSIFHDNHLCGLQTSLLLLFVRAVICQVSVVFLSSLTGSSWLPRWIKTTFWCLPTSLAEKVTSWKFAWRPLQLLTPTSFHLTALAGWLVPPVRTGVHFFPFVSACCRLGAEKWQRCASDFGWHVSCCPNT